MSRPQIACVALLCTLLSAPVLADIVTTIDGSRLSGTVTQITPAALTLTTSYAGTLTILMPQVESFTTEGSLTTRLTDDTMVTGVTRLGADRTLFVQNETLTATAQLSNIRAAWQPDATPPAESGIAPDRRWVYSVGADIAGKSGNSDELSTNFVGDMALVTKQDELRMYGSYQRTETESVETSDETKLGASYTAFMYDPWGWYVRGELEKDPFEDIDLRTTLSAGLTYRPINTETRMLRFWSGLGYRHESFESGVDESSPTLDVGISHKWVAKPWLTLTNDLSISPAVDDFGDYLMTHDSSFEMPVGASKWLLRLGIRNDYKSEPAPGREELDTTYYSRLFLRFD